MATLDELVTPLTEEEVETFLYDFAAARGLKTTSWKVGAVVRTIVKGVAKLGAAFSRLQAEIAKSGFLELATGVWLTLVARYVYFVERDTGSFATGTVLASNSSGGVYAGVAGDLIFRNSTTGKSYRNTAAFSIGAGAINVEIAVQAIEIGTASTAAAGDIDTLETPLVGVTVTHTGAIVGTDPETDDQLRQRCYEKPASLSPNGPRDAYAFVARSAKRSDGTSIGVTRVRSVPAGDGTLTVYVATASGGVTGTAGDPLTDLGAIAEAVHTKVEPLCVTPTVTTATPQTNAVTYALWVHDWISMTDAEIEAAIEAAIIAFYSTQPIGGVVLSEGNPGNVFKQALESAMTRALPAGSIVDLQVATPVDDVEHDPDEVPVAGTVTATAITRVQDDLAGGGGAS